MNLDSLPAKVRTGLEPLLKGRKPVSIARMSGAVDAESGEGYVVALKDCLYVFSRTLGSYEYSMRKLSYAEDIELLVIRKENYGIVMEVTTATGTMIMKFAAYQENLLQPVLKQWGAAKGLESGASATAIVRLIEKEDARELSPYVTAAAWLIFVASIDGDINDAEDGYIRRFCGNDERILKKAFAYYESHEKEDVLNLVAVMDRQQKLCILANAMDLAMSDGVLHRIEQDLNSRYARAANLSDNDVARVRDILLVKNQLSALYGWNMKGVMGKKKGRDSGGVQS